MMNPLPCLRPLLRDATLALLFLNFAVDAAGEVKAGTAADERSIRALAIDPANTQTLYAGTGSGAVFKSTDGGNTWAAVNTGLTGVSQGGTRITALIIDSSDP